MQKIMELLRKNKKRAYTIQELARLTNMFPLDVEMCVRELCGEDLVNVRWKERYENKKVVDYKLCVTYNKNPNKASKPISVVPQIMYQ
jgi:hypothetical protein